MTPSHVAGLDARLDGGIGAWWDWMVASRSGGEGRAAASASSVPPLIRFIREADRRWTVAAPTHDYRGSFADLRTALAFARRNYGAAAATLWFRVDGLVVVIPQEPGWPQLIIGDAR